MSDRYTIYHGDCLDILPTLEAGSIDAVITDPPYGIGANGQTLGLAGHKYKRSEKEWDVRVNLLPFLGYPYICIWGGNYYSDILPPSNQWLIWDKRNYACSFAEVEMAWTNYSPQTRIKHHHWGKEKEYHPTQKPLSIMLWSMSFLPDNITIFDPFMGSGTVGVAALKTGRRFIGIELDPDYFAIAETRIKNAAGDFVLTDKEKQTGQMSLFGD